MKNKKIPGLILIATIYALVTALLVVIHRFWEVNVFLNLAVGLGATTLLVFLFSTIFHNSSCYDLFWSFVPLVVVILLIGRMATIEVNVLVFLIPVAFWSGGLSFNWIRRFQGLSDEDWRYRRYRTKTGRWFPLVNLLGIHLFPSIMIYIGLIPVIFLLTQDQFPATILIGSSLTMLGLFIEAGADYTLHLHRRQGGGGLCQKGLWGYCRHPNYLGEILVWTGFCLSYLVLDWSHYYLALSPLAIFLMFYLVSIPMIEDRMVIRYGEYRLYQRQVNALLPLGRKSK